MKTEPIHRDLSTTFVDLTALVGHLHGLQFVGRIHVEMSSYEADIEFKDSRRIHAREYDHVSGRVSHGEQALRRILIRTKEPNGRISVYSAGREAKVCTAPDVFVDDSIIVGAKQMAFGRCDTSALTFVQARSAANPMSGANDLAELKDLVLELLMNADAAFEKWLLDFAVVLENACEMVAERYPFMDPAAGDVHYTDGRLYVRDGIGVQQLANGVVAALGHILMRLQEDADLHKLRQFTLHRMKLVLSRRGALLDRLMIRRQFEKLVEV
jgi:hypothetical protein